MAFAVSGIVLLINGIGQLMFAGLGLTLIGLFVLLFFAANEISKGMKLPLSFCNKKNYRFCFLPS